MDIDERLTSLETRLDEMGANLARLSGPHVQLSAGAIGEQGQQVEGPHAELVLAEGPGPGQTLGEWISGLVCGGGDFGRRAPGIIVDAGIARSTPCIRAALPNGGSLVFSRGIVGPLDSDQEALYCGSGYQDYTPDPTACARLEALREASQSCSNEVGALPAGEDRIAPYYACIGRELREKGVDL